MYSLSRIVETVIIYSPRLSNLLSTQNTPVRAVKSYKMLASIGLVNKNDGLIDSLVKFISSHPEYVSEWTDYPVLCIVALINNVRKSCDAMANESYLKIPFLFALIKNKYILSDFLSRCHEDLFDLYMMHLKQITSFEAYQDFILFYSLKNSKRIVNSIYIDCLPHHHHARIYSQAVFENTHKLYEIPDEYITYEMCLHAANKGLLTEASCIPVRLYDEKLSRCVAENVSYGLHHIPYMFLTEDLYVAGLSANPSYLNHDHIRLFPEDIIISVVVRAAVCNFKVYLKVLDMHDVEFIKTVTDAIEAYIKDISNFETKIKSVFTQNPKLISLVKNEQIVIRIIKVVDSSQQNDLVAYIDRETFTGQLAQFLFESHYSNIQFIPKCLRTNSMCNKAVSIDLRMIQYCTAERLTMEDYHRVVSLKGTLLEYVPKNMRSYDICKTALLNTFDSHISVPIELKFRLFKEILAEKVDARDYDFILNLMDHYLEHRMSFVILRSLLKEEHYRQLLNRKPNFLMNPFSRFYFMQTSPYIDLMDTITALGNDFLELQATGNMILTRDKHAETEFKNALDEETCIRLIENNIKLLEYIPMNCITSRMHTIMYEKFIERGYFYEPLDNYFDILSMIMYNFD